MGGGRAAPLVGEGERHRLWGRGAGEGEELYRQCGKGEWCRRNREKNEAVDSVGRGVWITKIKSVNFCL